MKSNTPHLLASNCSASRLRDASIKGIFCTLVGCLILQSPASAQQAPVSPVTGNASGESVDASPSIIKQSSSQISDEEFEAYIAAVSANFVIKDRKMDPFGQVQDPSAKVVAKKSTNRRQKGPRTNYKPTPFSEVVSRIRVTTIMPGENRFMIGTRSFKKGDQFPLRYRGRDIPVKVVGVTSTKIDLENTNDGEISSVELDLLPPGMKLGSSDITPPGVVTADKNAAVEVGPSN